VNRRDLDLMERDELVERALAAGVLGARAMTRPELVDEILLRSSEPPESLGESRGFFGRARDLLAKVASLGPKEGVLSPASQPPPEPEDVCVLPTVTLARIYRAQGAEADARRVLGEILEHDPEHSEARALLRKLDGEPDGVRPDAPPRQASPQPLCLAWPVAEDRIRVVHEGVGRAVLELLEIAPTWEGPRTTVRRIDVLGDATTDVAVTPGVVTRVALGTVESGIFIPKAHSPLVERAERAVAGTLSGATAGREFVRWTLEGFESLLPDQQAVLQASSAS
jgi:hypothetical protein